MSKLIDAVYGNFDNEFIVTKTIHISLKGKNIGTNTFVGMLLNQIVKDEILK